MSLLKIWHPSRFIADGGTGANLTCSESNLVARVKYTRGELEHIIDKEWRFFTARWICLGIAAETLKFSVSFERTVEPLSSAEIINWGDATSIRNVVELTVTEVNLDSQLPEYMMTCETILPLRHQNMHFVTTIEENNPDKLVMELNFAKLDVESSIAIDLFYHLALGDFSLNGTGNRQDQACFVKASVKTSPSSASLCEFRSLESFNYLHIWVLQPFSMLHICETSYVGSVGYLVLEPEGYGADMDCAFPDTADIAPIKPLVKIWETRADRLTPT